MVRVGQRIDDLEFEFYQNDDIKKGKFSDYPGKWLVLLFWRRSEATLRSMGGRYWRHMRKLARR